MADSLLLQAQGERVGAARSADILQRIKNEEENARLAPPPASVCAIVNGTASADFWRQHVQRVARGEDGQHARLRCKARHRSPAAPAAAASTYQMLSPSALSSVIQQQRQTSYGKVGSLKGCTCTCLFV